jgi:Meiotically up-regulated gene 113
MSAGTVYVIQSGAYYKIGRTTNLKQRLDALQLAHPASVMVCYQLDTPENASLECYLHQRFDRVRVRGEWFALSAVDLKWLQSIRQWTRDDAERAGIPTRRTVAMATAQPQPGSLRELLKQHDIHTIRELTHRTGLSRQQGWNLWWAEAGVGKETMKLLHERLGIPTDELLQVDPVPRRRRTASAPAEPQKVSES